MGRLVALLIVLSACSEKNAEFCQGNPADPRCVDAGVGAACDDNNPCTAGVCKTPPGVCVGCLVNADCTGTTPTCDVAANTCGACTKHADCDSQACLPSGACAAATDVAYVAAGGTGTDCTSTTPCDTLAKALLKNRSFVKFQGTGMVADSALTSIDGKSITILADPGARLSRTTAGPILEVKNTGANVTILDLQITGGLSTAGDALTLSGGTANLTLQRVALVGNTGRGVFAASGGKLVMSQCTVSLNTNGGANVQNIAIDMTNNLFVANGSAGSTTGGLTLSPNIGSVFEFNTVADNSSSGATASTRGVSCVIAFPADSNIVTGNALSPACTFESSLFDGVVPGTGNRMGNPMFANTDTSNPLSKTYYRIVAGSAAIDGAAAQAAAVVDIDGDARPQGAAKDMGADELK